MMCSKCAKSLPTGAETCPACGHGLSKEQKWATSYVPAKKFNRAGIWMLVAPFAVLIATLTLWAILSFVFATVVSAQETSLYTSSPSLLLESSSGTDVMRLDREELFSDPLVLGQADVRSTVSSIVMVILGLIGILAILGMFLWPLAIVFLFKKELAPGIDYDERSGKGPQSTVPEEVSGWNWGAAGLPMIWGGYYSVWMFFIGWIPLVNLVWWIVMGLKGNEWAWKKQKWISVEQFKYAQRKWMVWGIVFFVLNILFTLGSLAS